MYMYLVRKHKIYFYKLYNAATLSAIYITDTYIWCWAFVNELVDLLMMVTLKVCCVLNSKPVKKISSFNFISFFWIKNISLNDLSFSTGWKTIIKQLGLISCFQFIIIVLVRGGLLYFLKTIHLIITKQITKSNNHCHP
jgi:hypothetical protein